jgi:hypothetical protein
MGILPRFKLEKLKIRVYKTATRAEDDLVSTFKVMYNPESFSMKHANAYHKFQGINTSSRKALYSYSRSEELALDLILDGTGVGDFGASTLFGKGTPSVSKQVDQFLKLCFEMDGNLHEPKFLRIQWGKGELKAFDCRLHSVDVTYTSFDRSGAPLRAKLAANFVEDLDPSKRQKLENKHSPDLSQSRVVKAGDTLPLLCKAIYGDASQYLFVARQNELDDFRNLTPGQSLRFPPLT